MKEYLVNIKKVIPGRKGMSVYHVCFCVQGMGRSWEGKKGLSFFLEIENISEF